MSEENRRPQDAPTHASGAGLPVDHAEQVPSDAELDERDRSMARPRRAQGPPLHDDAPGAALRDAPPHEPPPATEPLSEERQGPLSEERQGPQDASTYTSDAGLPVNHVGPKPSHDEMDRRDRLMARPRRAQGPPLHDDAPGAALRDAPPHEPPPATEPRES
jgi:hypothetical protein